MPSRTSWGRSGTGIGGSGCGRADALGSIGGPKVVEAVLSLVKDKDEFIRRCAVEILIASKVHAGGESVLSSLLEALGDADWWVRERAIDALAGLGDRRPCRRSSA